VGLRRYLEKNFKIDESSGLDIFHNHFAPDCRWNPGSVFADNHLSPRLACLEQTFARSPDFIDPLVAVYRPAVSQRRAGQIPERENWSARHHAVRHRSATQDLERFQIG
jgi:hypothetical protein